MASPVVGRVPGMFRLLGIMYRCIGLVRMSLLMSPPSDEGKESSLGSSLEYRERASLTNGSTNVYDKAMMLEEDPSSNPKSSIPTSQSSAARGRKHQ